MPDLFAPEIRSFSWDKGLIESVKAKAAPQYLCYPFSHAAVVAGSGSNLSREVRLERISADHVPVYRRQGGGCSVFLDQGSLVVSVAFPASGILRIQSLFAQCIQWLMDGLSRAGIHGIYRDGISDLVIEDRKIGGSCLKRSNGFAYFSASILVSTDLLLMEKYLKHPPREPQYRKSRVHNDFVRNLDHYFPGTTVQGLAGELEKKLGPFFDNGQSFTLTHEPPLVILYKR